MESTNRERISVFGGKYLKLGKILDIPFGFAYSFLAFILFIAVVSPEWLPIYFFVFTSVTIHEFGHALTARRFGVNCHHIVLHILGGAAMLEVNYANTLDKKRWSTGEFIIAGAGPLTSFVLLFLSLSVWWLGVENYWLAWFIQINFFICVFNLLPVFPMDGGRLLRAGLTRKLGFHRATNISQWVARILVFASCAFALAKGYPIYLLLGIFILVLEELEVKRDLLLYDNLTGKVR